MLWAQMEREALICTVRCVVQVSGEVGFYLLVCGVFSVGKSSLSRGWWYCVWAPFNLDAIWFAQWFWSVDVKGYCYLFYSTACHNATVFSRIQFCQYHTKTLNSVRAYSDCWKIFYIFVTSGWSKHRVQKRFKFGAVSCKMYLSYLFDSHQMMTKCNYDIKNVWLSLYVWKHNTLLELIRE